MLALLWLSAAGACGESDGSDGAAGQDAKTFEGDGYSFTYPGTWRDITSDIKIYGGVGPDPQNFDVALSPREEGQDLVAVSVGLVSPSITEDNIGQLKDQIARVIESGFRQVEGRLSAGPTRVTVDGFPGLRFESTVPYEDVEARSQLTLMFDGRTQYAINCQFTPEGAEEVKRGCDQILSSFQVE